MHKTLLITQIDSISLHAAILFHYGSIYLHGIFKTDANMQKIITEIIDNELRKLIELFIK